MEINFFFCFENSDTVPIKSYYFSDPKIILTIFIEMKKKITFRFSMKNFLLHHF